MPVFGGGTTRFQPVYAGDIARFVEIACRNDGDIRKVLGGKIVEAGGPEGRPLFYTWNSIDRLCE